MLELSSATRQVHLAAMADTSLDILVIGGGITGAGIALDAAARGLRVGLVEQADFASGTSGRSSREIHGGLRYLRHAEFGLVRESLRERARLARLAPHLIWALPFLMPTRSSVDRAILRAGLMIYDRLATEDVVPRHRAVDADEAGRMSGGLVQNRSGYLFFETATDDARLTLEVIRQAASRGAVVANYARVEALLGQGRVRGAVVADTLTGERADISARVVVNATGAWADQLLRLAGRDTVALRPSKGIHLVFDRARLPLSSGLVIPSVVPGAFEFLIPWGERVYVGTTDTEYTGDLAEPPVEESDASIILDSLNRALPVTLRRDDVVASWAGVRPLLADKTGPTADISRHHLVAEDPPGLVTITGGKLTTFRVMAHDAVEQALRSMGTWAIADPPVHHLGLTSPLEAELALAGAESRRRGMDRWIGERLVRRYGDDWRQALAMIDARPELGDRLLPSLPVMRVEVALAREREMAITEDDILVRRTRLATMDEKAAASLRGSVLGRPAG